MISSEKFWTDESNTVQSISYFAIINYKILHLSCNGESSKELPSIFPVYLEIPLVWLFGLASKPKILYEARRI